MYHLTSLRKSSTRHRDKCHQWTLLQEVLGTGAVLSTSAGPSPPCRVYCSWIDSVDVLYSSCTTAVRCVLSMWIDFSVMSQFTKNVVSIFCKNPGTWDVKTLASRERVFIVTLYSQKAVKRNHERNSKRWAIAIWAAPLDRRSSALLGERHLPGLSAAKGSGVRVCAALLTRL